MRRGYGRPALVTTSRAVLRITSKQYAKKAKLLTGRRQRQAAGKEKEMNQGTINTKSHRDGCQSKKRRKFCSIDGVIKDTKNKMLRGVIVYHYGNTTTIDADSCGSITNARGNTYHISKKFPQDK